MDEYLSLVAVLLMLISVALPFLENYLEKRREKTRIECLLVANGHPWVSIEELAGHVGISIRTAIKNLEWGIKEKVIIGTLENNMFERIYERTHEEIVYLIPYEPDGL
ncbi:hypothetical protein EU528_07030 [Candidatus Thorarchaeota archaeon]|nr:MAG: hypothetical protein EU528_07030 [Candidatus Thorarchaeota archaeon]